MGLSIRAYARHRGVSDTAVHPTFRTKTSTISKFGKRLSSEAGVASVSKALGLDQRMLSTYKQNVLDNAVKREHGTNLYPSERFGIRWTPRSKQWKCCRW